MDEEKNKKNNLKQILTGLVYSIVTAIVSQLIILGDLTNFGNTTSGGGFIPYSFIVIAKIIAALIAITVFSVIIELKYKDEFKLRRNLAIAIVTAVVVYRINLIILI